MATEYQPLGPITTLSSFIRRRRTELNLLQSDVAKEVGVKSAEYISLVESGHRNLDLERIPRLAEVLKVNPAALARFALEEQYPLLAACLDKPKRGQKPERSATEDSFLHKLKELPFEAKQAIINMIETMHKQITPSNRRVA